MEISPILLEALSHDQAKRGQAEAQIDQIASNNFGGQKGVRQISATIIKNMINFSPKYKGKWEELNLDTKSQIKQRVLSTLASSDKDIRKAAALAIAGICKIEFPQGQWSDLIDVLVQTCKHENKNIRLASITTLGYISQEVQIRDLTEGQICLVLGAIYDLLKECEDDEIIETTMPALFNYISFFKLNFEKKDQRDAIMNLIYKFAQSQKVKIREICFQCLMDIARHYYDYIESNIPELLSLTRFHMAKDEENVIIYCYEFWCSIGDIEIARQSTRNHAVESKQYINKNHALLLEPVLIHLINTSRVNDDSWNLSKASSYFLSMMSQCCDYALIEKVIAYIGTNIDNKSSMNKEAAILAFGAILDTSHKVEISPVVSNSIETLTKFLLEEQYPNSLKETTAWVIEKIAELFGDLLIKSTSVFDNFYEIILGLIGVSSKKVVCYLCNTIHFLAKHLKPDEGQVSSQLSKHMKTSLEVLLRLAFMKGSYEADSNVAMSCFYAIGSLIENSASDSRYIIKSFFQELLKAFNSTLDRSHFESNKMRYDYQAYIASCLEPCIIAGHLDIDENEANAILQLIIQTFNDRGSVYEEGLMTASSLALAIQGNFDKFVTQFGSYLIHALNQSQETSLRRTAIHSTSDLIRSLGTAFNSYLDQIIPIILNILSDTEAHRSLKPHAFNVISDVFISCKDSVLPYFDRIMNLIGSALEAAGTNPIEEDDFEILEYFESLREHIVECLTLIFSTMKDLGREQEFKKYVGPIIHFINKINQKEYVPSINLSANSLGLIGDFCETYRGEIKSMLRVEVLEEMMNSVKSYKGTKYKNLIIWSENIILKAFK